MNPLARVALAFAWLLLGPGTAQAQEIVLKVHHFLPPTSNAHARFIVPWCERIQRDSKNRLKCQIYPAMQLGGTPAQLIDQVRDGVADIVWTLPGTTAGRFPAIEVFELPFMTKTAAGASRALWEFAQRNGLHRGEFRDVIPLAFHVHDEGVIHTVNKPVRRLADLRGLKLRTATRQTAKLFAALGATPVGMPVTQIADALSKGVVDGSIVPWEVVPTIKLNELARYHTETAPGARALYTTTFVFAMNTARYTALPAELRQVIDRHSGAELSAVLGRLWDESAAPARQQSLARGNTITVLDAAEVSRWEAAASGVAEAWLREASARGLDGAALLRSARELIRQYDAR